VILALIHATLQSIFGVIMDHNHATPVREKKYERRQYHDCTNPPLMVSLFANFNMRQTP
jgi:hypothetical protein